MDLDDEELLATRILNGVEKKRANTDTTYCKNENCSKKCWRHISNYKFDNDKDYWLMEMCEEERKRIEELLGVNMEEYIKILESHINLLKEFEDEQELVQALENLIKGYREKEESEKYLYNAYQDVGKKIFDYAEELEKKDKIIDLMAEQLTTPIHSKEWVKNYYEREIEQ